MHYTVITNAFSWGRGASLAEAMFNALRRTGRSRACTEVQVFVTSKQPVVNEMGHVILEEDNTLIEQYTGAIPYELFHRMDTFLMSVSEFEVVNDPELAE